MKASPKAYRVIKYYEKCHLEAYLCPSGIPTIGWGHTGKDVKIGMEPITQEQADKWLEQDVAEAEAAVNKYVKVPLLQHQFDALVSFVYNVGAGAFAKSTLVKVLNNKSYHAVVPQMKRWIYGSGNKVLKGLVHRRNVEAHLWTSNIVDFTVGPA